MSLRIGIVGLPNVGKSISMKNEPTHYQKYLAEIHAKNKTPDEIIRDVVFEATSLDSISKKKIIAGEVNEVYDVSLSGNKHVIVRISRREGPDFEQETWAINKCKKTGIPVPEILLVKHTEYAGKPLSICVQKMLNGDTLERGNIDFRKLPKEKVKIIITQAGEMLTKIHSIKTSGFGSLDGKGQGGFKTFQELMSEHLTKSDEFLKVARSIDLSAKKFNQIFKVISQNTSNLPSISPVLNHNDFGPKHIMIQGDQICGILDFGQVCGHSPINDFAKWDYWFGNELPLEWLMDGYQNKKLFDKNFNDIIHLIKLNNGLGVLWWYHEQNYQKAIEEAKKKLLKDLGYFE